MMMLWARRVHLPSPLSWQQAFGNPLIQPLAWERPYATSAELKSKKRKKERKREGERGREKEDEETEKERSNVMYNYYKTQFIIKLYKKD